MSQPTEQVMTVDGESNQMTNQLVKGASNALIMGTCCGRVELYCMSHQFLLLILLIKVLSECIFFPIIRSNLIKLLKLLLAIY